MVIDKLRNDGEALEMSILESSWASVLTLTTPPLVHISSQ